MRNAKRFLDLCTERFSSPRGCQHHSLTVVDGVLVLTLMQGDTWQAFDLAEADLDREPTLVCDELALLLSGQPVNSLSDDQQIPDDTA